MRVNPHVLVPKPWKWEPSHAEAAAKSCMSEIAPVFRSRYNRGMNEETPQDAQSGATAPPLLRLCDAQVRRAGKIILDVDEFSIAEGESIAILGPNGSGKSTFVSLVTREAFPLHRDDAPVVFRGDPRMTLAEAKSCTGVVSSTMQDQIRVHLPADEVVVGGLFGSLGVPIRCKATAQQMERAHQALDELGIADLAKRDILTLSTGQARRVLIARALVNDPDVLVFDEPCSGLDPEGMYYVRRTISKLAHGGHAIILVTHYLEDIVPEIARVVLLKDGRIQAAGPKGDILTGERISQLFNVPASVAENEGSYYLRFEG